MLEDVKILKRDDKVLFYTNNFASAKRVLDMLEDYTHANTFFHINGDNYKVKSIRDKTITIEVEGEFEKQSVHVMQSY